MSQELSAELLDIENTIAKLQAKIEDMEERISQKYEVAIYMEKRFLESYDSFEEKRSKADDAARQYDQHWQPHINEYRKEIAKLEERKKQINEQLYAGMDESEDF